MRKRESKKDNKKKYICIKYILKTLNIIKTLFSPILFKTNRMGYLTEQLVVEQGQPLGLVALLARMD